MTAWLARVVVATLLVGGLAATALAQPRTRNVLILSSFEREFAQYSNYAQMFRSELNRRSPAPISFFEVSLQLALTPVQPREEETVEYLRSIFADQRLVEGAADDADAI